MCYINEVMHGVVYMTLVVYESPSYLNASVATSTVGVWCTGNHLMMHTRRRSWVIGLWNII